jgi:agmatinase
VTESKPKSRPERRPSPLTEPRVTVDGIIGQVDATVVPRYGGEPTFARLPRLADVPRADVAILGVPFDTGVSYRPGARFGPGHIRESSRLLRPYNPAAGVSPFAALQVADAGDLGVNPFDIALAITAIEHGARELLERAPRLLTLVGADIVEVAPAYDHAQITGIAAAHVGYELISALALGKR